MDWDIRAFVNAVSGTTLVQVRIGKLGTRKKLGSEMLITTGTIIKLIKENKDRK
jgi:hypothetical protein